MSKPIGVVIGRFQLTNPHTGHLKLMEQAAKENGNRLLILIGVSKAAPNFHDPLSYRARKQALENTLKVYANIQYDIMPIVDQEYAREWSENVDVLISSASEGAGGKIYTGSESGTFSEYRGKYLIVEVTTKGIHSTELRKGIVDSADYHTKHQDVRTGIILAHGLDFPTSYQTVDAMIIDPRKSRMLLGRRKNSLDWRLPGGFVDPTDSTLEDAVRREVAEETDLPLLDTPVYLGSYRVDDWRYRSSTDKILTAVFACRNEQDIARAGDDLAEVKWFPYEEIETMYRPSNLSKAVENCIAPNHKRLIEQFFLKARETKW